MKTQIMAIIFCGLVLFVACQRENNSSGAANSEGGGAHGHTASEPYNDSLNKPGANPVTSNSPTSPGNSTNQHPYK